MPTRSVGAANLEIIAKTLFAIQCFVVTLILLISTKIYVFVTEGDKTQLLLIQERC